MDKKYEISIKVLKKYLKKGNMSRCLRDILPYSNLSLIERTEVAKLVHKIVRYRRLYEYVLKKLNIPVSAESLVKIAAGLIKPKIYEDISECIRYSYSDYLCEILDESILRYLNVEPRNYMAVNISKISRDEVISILKEEGFIGRIVNDVESCIEISPEARYSKVIGRGLAHIQDLSSQIVSKYVSTLGDEILDYCAGSGGKSLTIKYFNKDIRLYAYDISERKRDALRRRASISDINIEILDKPEGIYEVVMVDAPCSGVGVARRNPEYKYVKEDDVINFYRQQIQILREASKKVRRYIVYIVCTLTPHETDRVIMNFISNSRNKFKIVDSVIATEKTKYGGFIKAHDILFLSVLEKVSTK